MAELGPWANTKPLAYVWQAWSLPAAPFNASRSGGLPGGSGLNKLDAFSFAIALEVARCDFKGLADLRHLWIVLAHGFDPLLGGQNLQPSYAGRKW
jgi:hypothetical protein